MNIIICDDRIDDRKNLSDLLSDYGEKRIMSLLLQNMILENSYAKNNQLWKHVSAIISGHQYAGGMDGLKTAMRDFKENIQNFQLCW